MRGKVPRIQIKAKAKKSTFKQKKIDLKRGILNEGVKIAAENILIAKILVYSAIKTNYLKLLFCADFSKCATSALLI